MPTTTANTALPSPPSSSPRILLRPPSHTPTPSPSPSSALPATTFIPPPSFLRGTWHVTHSSLPMWKKAQNVSITYTVLSSDSSGRPTFDNLVEYQTLGAEEGGAKKTVKGVEAPRENVEGAWRWRGKGWLMIASSDWEVLGYGRSTSSSSSFSTSTSSSTTSAPNPDPSAAGDGEGEMERKEDDWVVTYFAKTLFTPSGIDVYCRQREGLEESVYRGIVEALGGCGEEVRGLVGGLFEVKRTGV